MLLPAMFKNTVNNETNISRTRIRRGGLVKSGVKGIKWTMRWLRERQAMGILLTDAKLIKVDKSLDIEWYQKPGGPRGAFKDFWKMGVANKTKKPKVSDLIAFRGQLVEAGSVGDSIVEFVRGINFKTSTVSAIAMYRKLSPERNRGTVIIVLYKYD